MGTALSRQGVEPLGQGSEMRRSLCRRAALGAHLARRHRSLGHA
jgi:hypothetical protein